MPSNFEVTSELYRYDVQQLRSDSFVQSIEYHEQLGSTNQRAVELAGDPALRTPALVLARLQTSGRGRGSNGWWSSDGALTFSLILDLATISETQLSRASLTVGLAICTSIEHVADHPGVGLKWPNDIYVLSPLKKVAGVLIQIPATQPRRIVIGIGVNTNNSLVHAPADLQQRAIALCDVGPDQTDAPIAAGGTRLVEPLPPVLQTLRTTQASTSSKTGQTLSNQRLLIHILHQIHQLWERLKQGDDLSDRWRAYHLLENQPVEVDLYSRTLRGTCVGLGQDGALMVRVGNRVERCLGGTVTSFGESAGRSRGRPSRP